MSREQLRVVGDVPRERTSFVGRRDEVAAVTHLLYDGRLVTLIGPAGVGKTRLAHRVAARVGRDFPEGVWVVGLTAVREGTLVATSIARAVGAQEAGRDSLAALVEFLRDRQALIVLDAAEHVLDACAAVAEVVLRLAPPVRILVTSREVLRVAGERLFTVDRLPYPAAPRAAAQARQIPAQPRLPLGRRLAAAGSGYDAMELFAERARAVLPAFAVDQSNEAAVAALCRRLDGLPLAIELTVPRLRALTPAQVLAELEGRLDPLVARHGVLGRPRTLRAVLDWIFELCTPAEQDVWARLSVFVGAFGSVAATDVCTGGVVRRDAAFAVLEALAAKSVLVSHAEDGTVRWLVPEPLRQYGLARLRERGEEDALRQRHAEWYLCLAARGGSEWFGPRELEWLARVQNEHANLCAALEYAITAHGESHAGLRIVAALWFYWVHACPATEARHWLERALTHDRIPSAHRADALWVAGYLAIEQYDFRAAVRMLNQAWDLAIRFGDRRAQAWITSRRQVLAMYDGDLAGAAALGADALDRFRGLGTPDGVGAVLTRLALATVRLYRGDLAGAAGLGHEVRAICQAHGEQTMLPAGLLILARVAWLRGDLDSADAHARSALRLRRHVPQPDVIIHAVDVLSWVAAAGGEPERAAVLLGCLHQIWRTCGPATSQSAVFVEPRREAEMRVRRAIGHAAYRAGFARGAGLDVPQIVAYSLGERPGRRQRTRDVGVHERRRVP